MNGPGRYQLGERIAAGGMAEIYAATGGDGSYGGPIVIKRMLDHLATDRSFRDMFVDEARLSTRLDHPNVVRVIDFEASEAGLFLVMEYVDGPDLLLVLSRLAKAGRALPPELAVYIACHTLEALDYAHTAQANGRPLNIVHRDVSPSNILLSRRGHVKLADFGIARATERQNESASGTLKGKYGYMSPEQVAGGKLDGRSDVFSLGIVLAEMLTGRRLFMAKTDLDLLLMVRRADLTRLERYGADIPPDLSLILRRALAPDREERHRSAAELRDELTDWLSRSPQRTGAAKLSELIAELEQGGNELRRRHGAVSPGSAPGSVPTLSGTNTKFQRMEVARIRRSGREQFRVGAGAGTSVGARPPTAPPAGPDESTQPVAVVDAPRFSRIVRLESGMLGNTYLFDLLAEVVRHRHNGLLRLTSEQGNAEVFFRDGHPRLVRSTVPSHRLGEFLVSRGVLTLSQLARAVQALPMFEGRMARTLVELGLVRPIDAVNLLTDQVSHTLEEWSYWAGTYEFHAGVDSPAPDLEIHIDTYDLLSRAMELVPVDLVRGWIEAVPPVMLRGPVTLPEAFSLSLPVATAIGRLALDRSLKDELTVIGPGRGQAELLRAGYLLWRCGLLSTGRRPPPPPPGR